ncbi:hypothetical protein HSX10_16320 [Winogradskyella undariae]|uniref:DUF456 domain-containing protein n=1 Tax=Winogradskyella undariae TaxID=1285465 RepID=UPI00156BB358|nr:DUF456 domain-containing protein [Winogradskyella undariae]NRR93143.1 hypothetical protein [Winogradskyella undariae]
MKIIKKFKSKIAYALTIVFLFPTMYSCTTDKLTNEFEENATYDQIAQKYEGSAKQIADAIRLVNSELQNSFQEKQINGVEITQELVDQYAVAAGYDKGEFTVALVEEVMDKNEDLITYGYMQVLDDYNLTGFTKLKIQEILDGQAWISDLQNSPNYANLATNEKEMLTFINTVAKESSSFTPTEKARFWDGFTSFGVGAIAGGVLFGPLGMFFGGLIGTYVNNLAKNS